MAIFGLYIYFSFSLFWVTCEKTPSYKWDSSANGWWLGVNNFHLLLQLIVWTSCEMGLPLFPFRSRAWFQTRGSQDMGLVFTHFPVKQSCNTRWYTAEFLCHKNKLVLKLRDCNIWNSLHEYIWLKWEKSVLVGFWNYSFANITIKKSCKWWKLWVMRIVW